MADTNRQPDEGYSPQMDARAHESTYDGFVMFMAIGAVVVACWVVALALGGLRAAWLTAIIAVIVSSIAGAVGALKPSIAWRAPAVVFILLLLALAVY